MHVLWIHTVLVRVSLMRTTCYMLQYCVNSTVCHHCTSNHFQMYIFLICIVFFFSNRQHTLHCQRLLSQLYNVTIHRVFICSINIMSKQYGDTQCICVKNCQQLLERYAKIWQQVNPVVWASLRNSLQATRSGFTVKRTIGTKFKTFPQT